LGAGFFFPCAVKVNTESVFVVTQSHLKQSHLVHLHLLLFILFSTSIDFSTDLTRQLPLVQSVDLSVDLLMVLFTLTETPRLFRSTLTLKDLFLLLHDRASASLLLFPLEKLPVKKMVAKATNIKTKFFMLFSGLSNYFFLGLRFSL
jgi:hypothetical protein